MPDGIFCGHFSTPIILSRPFKFLIAIPIFVGLNFYLAFLGALHSILGIDKDEKKKEKPKTKSKEPDE